jgi:hypothetical protein
VKKCEFGSTVLGKSGFGKNNISKKNLGPKVPKNSTKSQKSQGPKVQNFLIFWAAQLDLITYLPEKKFAKKNSPVVCEGETT